MTAETSTAAPPTEHKPAWNVLLVTDDPALFAGICQPLTTYGMTLTTSTLTGTVSQPLRPAGCCAVIVDARESVSRAVQVIEHFRHLVRDLPLLAMLSRVEPESALPCVAAGADDVVGFTGQAQETVARLCALRHRSAVSERCVAGDLALSPGTRQAWKGARLLSLSGRQFDLLHLLIRRAGQVVSRAEIQASMAIAGDQEASNLIEVHVHHLRRRIGADRLLTIRGRGYRLLP